jgi:hypothetical protein
MALTPTLPDISQNDLFNSAFSWEPKYANRFIMQLAGTNIPAYLVKAAARPTITNGEIVLDHINIDRKVKGKSRWSDVSISIYDPITSEGAQAVMEWVRFHHESLTGRDGYSTDYKRDLEFYSLSALGEKIENWTLKGAFISDANFGNMDWGTEEAMMIELTLKYDYAILQY